MSLANHNLRIQIMSNGREIQNYIIEDIEIGPQSAKTFPIRMPRIGGEVILTAALELKISDGLLPAGHEIAWEQFQITQPSMIKGRLDGPELELMESEVGFTFRNSSTELSISKGGEIASWSFGEERLVSGSLNPNFWRPPTDNDLGNDMPAWAKVWQESSYKLKPELTGRPTKLKDGSIQFEAGYTLVAQVGKVILKYTLYPSGSLHLEYAFETLAEELPDIPRIGVQLQLPDHFKKLEWYGRGPNESYQDRKSGQKVGVYQGLVNEQFHRYSRPQETGNKTDVRWMSLVSDKVQLTAYSTTGLLNSSTWPFDMEELDHNAETSQQSASGLVPVTSRHGADIELQELVTWNIDLGQMGVGGDTSWGRMVHDEYRLPAKSYSYSFWLMPAMID